MRIRMGHRRSGRGSAKKREPVLVNDVTPILQLHQRQRQSCALRLAVPLIVKNRVIGVIDIQSEQVGYFRPEHLRMLTLTASRIGAGHRECAPVHSRLAPGGNARVLNEISRELTSILNLDAAARAVGQLLTRMIDYQMFTCCSINEQNDALDIRYSVRFKASVQANPRSVPLDRGLVGRRRQGRKVINAGDVRKDSRYVVVNTEIPIGDGGTADLQGNRDRRARS